MNFEMSNGSSGASLVSPVSRCTTGRYYRWHVASSSYKETSQTIYFLSILFQCSGLLQKERQALSILWLSRLIIDPFMTNDCAPEFWLVKIGFIARRVPQKLALCFVKLIARLCCRLHFLSFGFFNCTQRLG